MNFENLIFLEGTACLFKTTALLSLQECGYKVMFSDFEQDIKKFPHYKSKADVKHFDLEYSIFKVANIFSQKTKYDFCDRTPIANWFYSLIIKDMENTIDLDIIANQLPEVFKEFCKNLKVLILVCAEGSEGKTYNRMLERNNGLDYEILQYVLSQNKVFKFFGNFFNWPILTIENEKNIKDIQLTLIRMMKHEESDSNTVNIDVTNVPLLKHYKNDAGYDLRSADHLIIEAGRSMKIKIASKIILPPGSVGLIASRSSSNLIVNTG